MKFKILLLFSILFATILIYEVFFDFALGCDGGWYSYPALSISNGGNAFDNLKTIEENSNSNGIKSIFGFSTAYSIRTLYTVLWFDLFPKNIFSLKILSLIELLILFLFFYLLLLKVTNDRVFSLLILAIFINDKSLLLLAAGDFRPDLFVAALSCLTFIFLHDNKTYLSIILAFIFAILLTLTHVTAVIPLSLIFSFFLIYNFQTRKNPLQKNLKLFVIIIISASVFLIKDNIFNFIFSSNTPITDSSVNIYAKIENLFSQNLSFFLRKEIIRWKDYFLISNIGELIFIFVGLTIFIINPNRKDYDKSFAISLFIGIIISCIVLMVIDPHETSSHAIPVIPFIFLLIAVLMKITNKEIVNVNLILAIFVFITTISSMLFTIKIIYENRNNNYATMSIINSVDNIFKPNKRYLIVGPTEVWPYIRGDINVVIIDNTRSGRDFSLLKNYLRDIDYVILNRDYFKYRWKEKFYKYYSECYLQKISPIGNNDKFIEIYKIKFY